MIDSWCLVLRLIDLLVVWFCLLWVLCVLIGVCLFALVCFGVVRASLDVWVLGDFRLWVS